MSSHPEARPVLDPVFYRLAARLDELPNGFPPTQNGVELRILAKIFSADDAAMALHLLPLPETAERISRRLGEPHAELTVRLDGMAERGQIAALRHHGEKTYLLASFVVGIYEFQLERMDAELAALVEEYLPSLMATLGGTAPALARVVPTATRITGEAAVLQTRTVREMMAAANDFRIAACICRKEKALLGAPCTHTLETCLSFSADEHAYDGMPSWGRRVSRDEALALLDLAEQEGLVHCTYNLRSSNMFVCNCCSCCCGFLRGVKELGAPHLLVRSNVVAVVDPAVCLQCGLCAAPRCPMDAITQGPEGFSVAGGKCIGCGVCTVACPSGAITLAPRPERERTTPSRNLATWALTRSVRRHGLARATLQAGRLALESLRTRRG